MKKIIFICLFLFPGIIHSQWVKVNNGMTNPYATSFASIGNTLFASGVYSTTNNGDLWTQSSYSGGNYLASAGNYLYSGDVGIHLSTNNGTSWLFLGIYERCVHCIAATGNYIFFGATICGQANTQAFYSSTDNGVSWIQNFSINHLVNSIAINGSNIFAGSTGGVYKSSDSGINWTITSLGNPFVHSLAANQNNIFAGTDYGTPGGVFVSADNGVNWALTLNNLYIYSLAVNGNIAFAGTYQNGVYVSNNNGTSWTQRNEGLGNARINALCIFNNYVFAATQDSGIYRRPLSEITGIHPISTEIPNQFSLSQNYPNPFNPGTVIKFQVANSRFVKLSIYDALGREAETIVNEQLNAGTYETYWNATNYPSGVYFYKITAGDYTATRKMVLVK